MLGLFILLSLFCNAQKTEIPKLPEWISSQYVTEHYNGYTLKYFPKKLVEFLHKKRPIIQNNIISFGRVIGIKDITQYNGNIQEGVKIAYEGGIPKMLFLLRDNDVIMYCMEIAPGTKSPNWIKNGYFGDNGLTWWSNGQMKYYKDNQLVWDNKPKALASQDLFNSNGVFKDYDGIINSENGFCKYDMKTKNGKLIYLKRDCLENNDSYREFIIEDDYFKGKNPKTDKFDALFPVEGFNYTIINRKPTKYTEEFQLKYEADILEFIKMFFMLVESAAEKQ